MAIQQRKQTNILLTFKVLQFVNQLRRRVKPRVLEASIGPSHLGAEDPLGLRSISEGLSRISVPDAKPTQSVTHRVCKSRRRDKKITRSLPRGQKSGLSISAGPNVSGDELQHMLSSVDNKLNATGNTFSAIASNNKFFLKHNNAPIFEASSLNETVRLLVAVQDAIDILSECRAQYGDHWLAAQGHDIGLSIDENFIANYEHMLLRLRAELVEALARKALEELLRGGHDKKQRKLLSWFTEFAEKPRPLSTSFPWTIKSSLAVLWGVCWMFYDNNPDEQAVRGGSDRVRQDRVLQHLDFEWNTPASSDYINLGRALIGTPPQHASQQQTSIDGNVGLENDPFQARNTGTWESDIDHGQFRLPNNEVSQAAFARAAPLPQLPGHGIYYGPTHQNFPGVSPNKSYLPQFQGTATLTAFPLVPNQPWQIPFTSLPQQSPRHLITSPQIRVNGVSAEPRELFTQPQTAFASFGGLYQPARRPQASPLPLNTNFDYNNSQYIMASALSPENSAMHISVKHERTSSVNSNTNMPTPVSISGPRSPLLSPTSNDHRHIVASPTTHSRQTSISSSQGDDDDDLSLRKNHTYKRAEEPARNQEGKMVCRYDECTGQTFDRKCEWSKHMDKHDRPYKCNVKGCEKLQGFTYSGGLLRHEREVHKMHGGTKKSLFCPFHDCKRSSGAGFTRKENLAEHIRRVHRRTSMSADMGGLVMRRETLDNSPIPESRVASESPYNRAIDFREEDELTLKRKRGSDSGFSDRGNDEMRAEIKRLRQEVDERDSRLQNLEKAMVTLQQQIRR